MFFLGKGSGDPVKAAKIMTEEMEEYYRDGYTFQFDVPLSYFVVDWDIK